MIETIYAPAHAALDLGEQIGLVVRNEGDRIPRLLCTRSSADAVDIIGRLRRNIVVDDVAQIEDVDAARGYVGSDENAVPPLLERVKRATSLGLRSIAVNAFRADIVFREHGGYALRTRFCACENDCAEDLVVFFQKIDEQIGFLVLLNGVHGLRDGFQRRCGGREIHAYRVVQQFSREGLCGTGECGRKEQRLTALRKLRDNALNRGQKSHVEHAVRFVEHKNANVFQAGFMLLHEIDEPAGRCDDHFGAAPERLNLRTHAHAAVDGRNANFRMFREVAKMIGDLLCEFSRGRKNECSRFTGRCLEKRLEDGQAKGRRFAAARWGTGKNVTAAQGSRNGQTLYGRRLFVL